MAYKLTQGWPQRLFDGAFPLAILIVALALSLFNKAQAQELHLQVHGLSYHQERTQINGKKWNELNYGIGVRYQATESTDVQLGVFRNSQYNNSVYAIATWLPLEITNSVRIGVFAGTANGYSLNNGNFIPVGGVASRWQGERFSVTSRLLPKTSNSESGVIAFEFGIEF